MSGELIMGCDCCDGGKTMFVADCRLCGGEVYLCKSCNDSLSAADLICGLCNPPTPTKIVIDDDYYLPRAN